MEEKNTTDIKQIKKFTFYKNNKINKINFFNTIGNYYLFPTNFKIKILENKKNMSYSEIITIIEEQNFEIISNGAVIFRIPIGFFTKLYGLIQRKNKISIPIDFKMFFSNVIFEFYYNMLTFLINCDFTKYGLNLELKMKIEFQKVENQRTNNEIIENMFFQYIQDSIVDTNNQQSLTTILNHNHITKGFFINANLDSISRLKLILNGHDRFDYDEIFLHTICIKINDELFYVPLDINEKFYDCTESSYYSSINLSRIDTTRVVFEFKNAPQTLRIYSLSGNFLRKCRGAMGLMFSN